MVLKRTDPHLRESAKVEVASNEDGYRGAWYAATVLEPDPTPTPTAAKRRRSFSRNTKLLVQYDALLRDDATGEPKTELVKAGFIRPPPPPDDADRSFEVGDAVDALNPDGWWPGVVIHVEGDTYTVGYRDPPDLAVVRRPEVRQHWDFKDGAWVRAHKLESVKGYEFSHGTAIEVNLNKEVLLCAWFPATYLGQLGINSHLLQHESSEGRAIKVVVESHQFRPPPPNLPRSGFSLLETVDAFHDMGWHVGGITKVLTEEHYMVRFKYTRQEMECSRSEMRPHLDWIGGKWVTKKNRTYVPIFEEVQIGNEQFSKGYDLRPKRVYDRFGSSEVATPLEITKYSTEEKTACSKISWKNQAKYLSPNVDESTSGKTKKRLKMSQQANDDTSILSACKKLNWGNSEDFFTSSEVYERRTPVEISNQNAPVREAENSEQLQRRKLKIGARKKVGVMKGSETMKAGQEDVEGEPVMDNPEFSGIRSESEVSHVGTSGLMPMEEVEQLNEDEPSSEIKGKDQLLQLLDECSKDPETVCGREEDNGAGPISVECMNAVYELPAITKLDLIGEKPNDIGVGAEIELTKTKAVEDKGAVDALVVAETVDSATDNVTKDQLALSFFIEETHSPKTIEGSSNPASTANQPTKLPSNSAGTANEHNDIRGTQGENGVTGNVQQQDSPHLPFVKNYLQIWESIESMDAFKRYPQHPHFHPLVKCEELDREPIAIAQMIRFSSLVDKIPKLQVENFRDFFHSSLKALAELETFGFDVKEVRSFLNSLLEMRVKLDELQDQSKELEVEVVKRTHDRTNNKEEIRVVDKEIKDLQETVKVLDERRAVLMSMDAAKGSEISRLESESSDITKSIQSIMRAFEEQVFAF